MKIKPIKNKKDYQQALSRLEKIFDAKKGTPDGDELLVLGILIDNYENAEFPIDEAQQIAIDKALEEAKAGKLTPDEEVMKMNPFKFKY